MNHLKKCGPAVALRYTFFECFTAKHCSRFLSTTQLDPRVKPMKDLPALNALKSITDFIRKGGFKNLREIQQAKFEELGPIFVEKTFGRDVVHVVEAEAHAAVFRNEGKFPTRGILIDKQLFRQAPIHRVQTDDYEIWNESRSPVAKSLLRPPEVQRYSFGIDSIAQDAVKRLESVTNPILSFEASGFSTESICWLVYGERFGFYDTPPNPLILRFIKATEMFSEALLQLQLRPPIWKYVATPTYKKMFAAREELFSLARQFSKISKERKRENFFLIDKMAGKAEDDVCEVALALSQAGVETTRSSVVWFLYSMAQNPKIQEKAYKEIVSTIGMTTSDKSPQDSTYVSKLPYLTTCIKESMRMFPIVSFLSRQLDQDTVISGYNIPKQTIVMMWNLPVKYLSRNFKNPDQFIPERWLRENRDEEMNAFSHLPFGFGVRTCLGRRFAEMELLILMARILQNFRVEFNAEPDVKPITAVGLTVPDKEPNIVFVKRQ